MTDKERQDKNWESLTPELKEVTIKNYRTFEETVAGDPSPIEYTRGMNRMRALEETFGKHNLTSEIPEDDIPWEIKISVCHGYPDLNPGEYSVLLRDKSRALRIASELRKTLDQLKSEE